MSTTPNKSLSGWNIFWIVVAGLFVLGLFTGGASSGSKPSTGGSYTATTLSTWCETHAEDKWSGEMDSTTRRYLAECAHS